MWEWIGKTMTKLSLKKRLMPVVAIGAAISLSACASGGLGGLNAKNLNTLNNINNGLNQAQAFNTLIQCNGF